VLFNSLAFAIFLPTVFFLYWLLPNTYIRAQNILILIASYVFYGMWDWRFLSLIVISSLVDYTVGFQLQKTDKFSLRRILLVVSLIVNIGLLGFFKYFDFFSESFIELLNLFGIQGSIHTLNIILPVGISFYTFQTLSYTIDIYRKQIEPTKDPIAFFAFVSFFPQLVAGPIERAKNFLPQFERERMFHMEQAKDGLRQILWGLFKKVVLADNLGQHVDAIYGNYTEFHGIELAMGTLFFAFQIYCDFSGYSDIAIGTARLFGFDLSRNFAYPYFSRDIAEFWRRWHISLSSWFRDYLYIPLGGSRTNTWRRIRNILVTFTVSGFWHGANWNFIAWGFLNGLYYIPLMLANKQRQYTDTVAEKRWLTSARECLHMLVTFVIVLFAWVFFRSPSLEHALDYIKYTLTQDWLVIPDFKRPVMYVGVIVMIEWFQRLKQHGLQIDHLPQWLRWAIYYGVIATIFWYGHTGHVPFIYFQF
jgi:alginate O-acetyltransferase complex protein AlgI